MGQAGCLRGYLYLADLNVCLGDLCFASLYLRGLRRIQDALIKTQ